MSQIKITTKTPEQIGAAFAAAVKDYEAKRPSQATRLEPYRTEIMKLRRRGYTWKQVAQIMGDPQIGEKVSVKLLVKVFGGRTDASASGDAARPETGAASVPKAVPAATPAAAPASVPARRHLVLDPAKGQRIT